LFSVLLSTIKKRIGISQLGWHWTSFSCRQGGFTNEIIKPNCLTKHLPGPLPLIENTLDIKARRDSAEGRVTLAIMSYDFHIV
jgi:hypothetical protein